MVWIEEERDRGFGGRKREMGGLEGGRERWVVWREEERERKRDWGFGGRKGERDS